MAGKEYEKKKYPIDDKRIDMPLFYKELSERTGFSEELVKQVVVHLFKRIRAYMQLPSFPDIVVAGLFRFKFEYNKLEKLLNFTRFNYEQNNVGKSYYDNVVANYQEVINLRKKKSKKNANEQQS